MGLISCAVLGCDDKISTRHRFPKPKTNMELYNTWLAIIGNPVLFTLEPQVVYNNRRVCHRHFEEKYVNVGSTRIHKTAKPALYINGESQNEFEYNIDSYIVFLMHL